ncbi:MAG: ABC transporter substrate-binding protein [Sporichthyaceae bacterium]|nr:ABC transporter substrate-binding protein [Sporichthyaceae bacterium]
MTARQAARTAAFLAAATLALSACSSDDSNGTPAEGQVGGTLIVARTGDITGLDPHTATAFQTIHALELVHGTLVRLDQDLKIVPGLAESWEFAPDNSTLTFKLRGGVTYHDGDPFTSADVAATLERIKDEATAAVGASNFADVSSVDTPDDATVVLNLSGPGGPVLAALADTNSSILSDEDIAGGTAATTPNGTGPFKWVAWNEGRSVQLARNPDFWGGAPKLDAVEFRVIPDEASVLNALRANEAQLGVLTDPTVVSQVGDPLEVLRAPALAYHALMLNGARGPLADEKVRQAISCAVDRQAVIDTAAFGEGQDVGPITSPAYAIADPSAGRPCPQRDVDRARTLLADAGQGDGFTLNTIVMTGGYATAAAEAQTLQAQLAEIGVELELETLETGTYVERWLAADFDAAVALNSGRVDPHTMYGRYFTTGGALNTVAGYASPTLDDILARGAAETDPTARQPIYQEFAAALETASPWVWLFRGYEYRVITPRVSGYTAMPNGSLQYLAVTSLTQQ